MTTTPQSRLTYKIVLYSTDADGRLTFDKACASHVEVFDERGATVGFISNVREKPPQKWRIKRRYDDGTYDHLAAEHATINDALLALEREIAKSRWRVS